MGGLRRVTMYGGVLGLVWSLSLHPSSITCPRLLLPSLVRLFLSVPLASHALPQAVKPCRCSPHQLRRRRRRCSCPPPRLSFPLPPVVLSVVPSVVRALCASRPCRLRSAPPSLSSPLLLSVLLSSPAFSALLSLRISSVWPRLACVPARCDEIRAVCAGCGYPLPGPLAAAGGRVYFAGGWLSVDIYYKPAVGPLPPLRLRTERPTQRIRTTARR